MGLVNVCVYVEEILVGANILLLIRRNIVRMCSYL